MWTFGSAIATGCSDITHEAVLNFRTRYLEKLKEILRVIHGLQIKCHSIFGIWGYLRQRFLRPVHSC